MISRGICTALACMTACGEPPEIVPDASCEHVRPGVLASEGFHAWPSPAHARGQGGELFIATATELGVSPQERAWAQRLSPTEGRLWGDGILFSPFPPFPGPDAWPYVHVRVLPMGEVMVLWSDDRRAPDTGGGLDLYARRLDPGSGGNLWPEDAVVSATDWVDVADRTRAGARGVWVNWPADPGDDTLSSFNAVLAYVAHDGAVSPPGGFVVGPMNHVQLDDMIAREDDDVLAAWVDAAPGGDGRLYGPGVLLVQRFAVGGTPVWAEPVRFDTATGVRRFAWLAGDSTDGAWIGQELQPAEPCVSECYRGCAANKRSWVQRIDSAGSRYWPGEGLLVMDGRDRIIAALPLASDGSMVVVGEHQATAENACTRSYFGVTVAADGSLRGPWPLGFVMGPSPGGYFRAATDGAFIYAASFDSRGGLRAQRFDVGATWGLGGEPLTVASACRPGSEGSFEIEPDGQGGLWLAWNEYDRLVVQHLDAQGLPTLFEAR